MSHPNLITDPADIKQFILGGAATFTLVSKHSSTRFTYKVDAAKDRDNFFFVKVLSGPDNTADYTYLGFIKDPYYPEVLAGNKGKRDAKSTVALNWYLHAVWRLSSHALEQAEFWHEGRCCRCNRLLTDPVSIERGIGPECAKRAAA